MPTFHPPLAHTSHVPIPAKNADHYIQLNFFATFADQEDSNGSWEIWTDLPALDHQGNITSSPGEWRAISFQQYQPSTITLNGNEQVNGHASEGVIYIKATSNHKESQPDFLTFYLPVVVPTSVGEQYSYTYRHITTSGETHWLGGIGGNGAIKLVEGDLEVRQKGVETGEWSEQPEGVNELQWNGIAVELQGNKRPTIHSLPSKVEISPHLVLLHTKSPLHRSSLSRTIASPAIASPTPSTEHLAIVANSAVLNVGPSSALPYPAQESSYASAKESLSVEVLTAAFRAAKAKQNRFRLAEVSGNNKDVVAIFVSSGEGEPEQTYLVIYASSLPSPDNLSIRLPENVTGTGPLAILSNYSELISYIPQSNNDLTDRKVKLHLDAGHVAEILQLAEFIELRGAGKDDPIWICAPDAVNVEIGEEEIPSPEPAATTPIADHSEVHPATIVAEGENRITPEAQPIEEQPVPPPAPAERRIDPIRPEEPASQSAQPSQGWWLFRLIGRVFVNFWEVFLWPFRSQPAITDGTVRPEDRENRGQEESTTELPANERTPLLGSQSMSRGTSSSSTAFDPLATPSSMIAAKEDHKSKQFTDGTVTPVGNGSSPDLISEQVLPTVNSVQIRSYAQMTFSHLPPFKFLLPPNSDDISSKIRFTVKEKAGKEWEEVRPEIQTKNDETKCKELIVQGNNGTGGTDWEVQIERI